MRFSKLIPLFLMAITAVVVVSFVGMGSFATDSDFTRTDFDRLRVYPTESFNLIDAGNSYSSLKVAMKRTKVMNILQKDGFYKVHERSFASHAPIHLGEERDAHNTIILEREASKLGSQEVEVVEILFRYERFLGKTREGLAHTPQIYTYEKI